MGLMSLLCCSSNTVEDNDKYINKSATATIPPKNEPKVINNHNHNHNHGKKRKDKKDDFDDNSVNETETIANTNEEPTPTTNGQNDLSIETTQEGSSSKQPTNTNTGDEVIIAQQNSNEDIIDLDLQDLDEESLMDLTKFQEGQYRNPETGWLLGKQLPQFKNKKCLILDLDETLVHSSFKYLRTADFVIPVEIDNQVHHVYVIKRPGVDEFLQKVGQWYEVVVFTASVQKYGDPLLNKLDIHQSIHHRLFRDSCYNYEGNFIKNLSQIGRPLSESIIIDNSPASYIFHPQHSVPISSWFSDTHDNELLDLLPFLEDLSKQNVDDVSLVLDLML